MGKKYLLIICLLFSFSGFSNSAFAYKVKTFPPLRVPQQNYDDNNNTQTSSDESYPRITEVEYMLFNKNFENENIYNRLSRIENKVFRRNFQNMALSARVDNILANIDEGAMYGISSAQLSKLERKVLGRTYTNEDTDSRITRLEKEMLGAMQGGNLRERYETVATAAKHYNSYPELAQSQGVYSPSNYSTTYANNTGWTPYQPKGINRIFQNVLGAVFGDTNSFGTMTGFTPPVYDQYNQYYNPGIGMQDYYMGNHGGYMQNRNLGSQSTVRILD